MNKLVLTSILAAAFAVSTAFGAPRAKLTPAERHAKMMARTGGIVQRPAKGKTFRLVNAAGIPADVLGRIADSIHSGLFFPMEVVSGAKTPKEALDAKAGFALLFVKNDGPRLLTAPEDGWAQVNVATLETADAALYENRLMKEAWRATAYALGGGNTFQPQCAMKPIASVAELDANAALVACPEVFPRMIDQAKKFGVMSNRPTTYIRACMEGWAPAPTNDAQKAIWDKVHKMPTAPLTIKPEAKKVKE